MGAAIIPMLETKIPGFDPFIEGKGLARFGDQLDEIADRLGLSTMGSMGDLEDDGHQLEPGWEQPWFDAKDGLKTMEGLMAHVQKHPEELSEPEWVVEELNVCRDILDRAADEGVRFCFILVP